MKTIKYLTKDTKAGTVYVELNRHDFDTLTLSIQSLLFYMGEMTLSKSEIAKKLVAWFTKPSKDLPYSSRFKRNNSPQSLLAGCYNNLVLGEQYDFSEEQLINVVEIINILTDGIGIFEEQNKSFQTTKLFDKITIRESLFEQD